MRRYFTPRLLLSLPRILAHSPLPLRSIALPVLNSIRRASYRRQTSREMPHIYTSELPSPPLPRQSIFHHLFPELDGPCSIPASTPTLIDGLTGKTLSREEVRLQAQRLAGGLHKAGLKTGDVVGVIGTNSLEWCNAVFGSLAGGMRVSPMNYAYTPPELLHQLTHSCVSLVFVGEDILPTLLKTLELGRVKGFTIPQERIILLSPPGSKNKQYKCVADLWTDPMEPVRFENGDEHETAWLCYSSGTTGLAKGVETTHYNMTSQLQALNAVYEPLEPGRDVVLGYLPFSHMYGLTLLIHQCLTVGVPLVVLPRFEESAVLRAIEKFRITFMLVVPPVLVILRNSTQLEKYDLSSLRGALSAAAPLSEELCKAVEARVKPLIIAQAYGLTETSPISHLTPLDSARGRQSKIGRLIPTFRARLVDPESGEDVEPGQAGELWLQSPSVMKGYYQNPEATRNTFSSEEEEGGRWFKTGDSAWVDEGGWFQIADRLKELIKYKGFQVAPAELEALLLTHPKIADAAVIGVHSEEQATELPKAFIVPKAGLGVSAGDTKNAKKEKAFKEEITAWVKEKVAHYKQLRGGIEIIEVVPKSPSGKILRKNLRTGAGFGDGLKGPGPKPKAKL